MRLSSIFGLCLAALTVCGPASAQPQQSVAVQNDVSLDQVMGLLTSTGAQVSRVEGQDTLLLARIGQQQFAVGLYACSETAPKRCGGSMLYTIYAGNPGMTGPMLNTFNLRFPPGKVFQMPDGTTVLSSFVLWTDGITSSNFMANIRLFLASDEIFQQFASQAGQGSGVSRFAPGDMSAFNAAHAKFTDELTMEAFEALSSLQTTAPLDTKTQ